MSFAAEGSHGSWCAANELVVMHKNDFMESDPTKQFFDRWAATSVGDTERHHLASSLAVMSHDFSKRGGWNEMPKVIFVTIHITNIKELDQITGQVEAAGSIHWRWFDERFAHLSQGETVEPEFMNPAGFIVWSPNANGLELNRFPVTHRKFPHHQPGECYTHATWNTTWSNVLGLKSFPFDMQQLRFSLMFSDGAFPNSPFHEYIFVPDYQYNPSLLSRRSHEWQWYISKPTMQGWSVHEPKLLFMVESGGEYEGPSKICVELRYVIKRNSRYYVTSFMGISFFTGLLTLTAYALKPTDIAERLGIVLTLLLTIQAIKFVMQTELPKVADLTVLDKYFWFCIVFLTMMCLLIAVLPHFYMEFPTSDIYKAPEDLTGDRRETFRQLVTMDRRVFHVSLFVFLIVHIELWLQVWYVNSKMNLGETLCQDDPEVDNIQVWVVDLLSLLFFKRKRN
ncbi:hypothetical protein CYMTET_6481 [Cymbomonas tetramitiformis]|uniref:Uncharacterized protein n=1 Tax=Cymbomonas tetramitiformis TaxID=36881 RepID=A0AAE0GX16_9CHLO|nr:hypothetical protein CYMTET_6481 [Cymbomonas tetramitiformis]|eukprot:gene8783-10410_t